MATWIKVTIIVVVTCVVLLIAVVGVGIYWVSKHGPELARSAEKNINEGRSFGGSTDDDGCVSETISRYKKEPGFNSSIATNLFLRGCLDTSHTTQGFCDGVPTRTEFMKSGQWQIKKCEEAGLAGDSYCNQFFSQVQQYCEQGQRKSVLGRTRGENTNESR